MSYKKEQERIAELKAKGNKHFIVTIFNMNSPKEKENVDIYAMTSDEAENRAISGGLVNLQSGWGVWGSKEVLDDYSYLTPTQLKGVKTHLDSVLSNIVTDACDRSNIVDAMLLPICEDIASCADWESLDGEEWCPADVDIAIARLLKEKFCEE